MKEGSEFSDVLKMIDSMTSMVEVELARKAIEKREKDMRRQLTRSFKVGDGVKVDLGSGFQACRVCRVNKMSVRVVNLEGAVFNVQPGVEIIDLDTNQSDKTRTQLMENVALFDV